MNKILSTISGIFTKKETQDQRFDRLVTESILSGPSKVYTDKEWDELNTEVNNMLDKLNNK